MTAEKLLKEYLWPLVSTCAIAAVIFSVLAPLGTHNFEFLPRMGFWFITCFLGGFGSTIFAMFADRYLCDLKGYYYVPLQALVAALPVFVFLVTFGFNNYALSSISGFFVSLGIVWLVGLIICTFSWFAHMRGTQADGTPSRDRPVLYERLPARLRRAQILALTSEDHYVRVITDQGDDMILMRLSDAIREMEPEPGLQTHRSWWVAEAGVEEVQKSGSKMTILLKNSAEAAVSRSGAKSVREAGWS